MFCEKNIQSTHKKDTFSVKFDILFFSVQLVDCLYTASIIHLTLLIPNSSIKSIECLAAESDWGRRLSIEAV